MGLTHVTLGWAADANGLAVSDSGRAALDQYIQTLASIEAATKPRSDCIKGFTYVPAAVVRSKNELVEAVRMVVTALVVS